MDEKTNKLQKLKKVFEIMSTEEFKDSFKLCKKQLFVIINKILPKKWSLRAHFGFDDPAITGQVLEVLAPIFPFVYEHVQIKPDFEEQIVEIDATAKGHIRGITVLICGLKILLNRKIWRTIKLFKRI